MSVGSCTGRHYSTDALTTQPSCSMARRSTGVTVGHTTSTAPTASGNVSRRRRRTARRNLGAQLCCTPPSP
uniref:Uncharacterized protein n=1 Tax=Arundo donax TaxID=35708 RepID=A0A0A8Y9N4_ARUDO